MQIHRIYGKSRVKFLTETVNFGVCREFWHLQQFDMILRALQNTWYEEGIAFVLFQWLFAQNSLKRNVLGTLRNGSDLCWNSIILSFLKIFQQNLAVTRVLLLLNSLLKLRAKIWTLRSKISTIVASGSSLYSPCSSTLTHWFMFNRKIQGTYSVFSVLKKNLGIGWIHRLGFSEYPFSIFVHHKGYYEHFLPGDRALVSIVSSPLSIIYLVSRLLVLKQKVFFKKNPHKICCRLFNAELLSDPKQRDHHLDKISWQRQISWSAAAAAARKRACVPLSVRFD